MELVKQWTATTDGVEAIEELHGAKRFVVQVFKTGSGHGSGNIDVSMDGENWRGVCGFQTDSSTPPYNGNGGWDAQEIDFPAKYVRFRTGFVDASTSIDVTAIVSD